MTSNREFWCVRECNRSLKVVDHQFPSVPLRYGKEQTGNGLATHY